jgi:hypothetical protein
LSRQPTENHPESRLGHFLAIVLTLTESVNDLVSLYGQPDVANRVRQHTKRQKALVAHIPAQGKCQKWALDCAIATKMRNMQIQLAGKKSVQEVWVYILLACLANYKYIYVREDEEHTVTFIKNAT